MTDTEIIRELTVMMSRIDYALSQDLRDKIGAVIEIAESRRRANMAEAVRAEDSKPELESPFVSTADISMEEITDAEACFLLKMMEEGRGKPSVFIGIMPMLGEYWIKDEGIGDPEIWRVVAFTTQPTYPILENATTGVTVMRTQQHWRHEPLCDGFDWQPQPVENALSTAKTAVNSVGMGTSA